jgi:Mrp family chromosome partitioning ATPase
MPDNCTSDCSACQADCASRKNPKASFQEKPHDLSRIKKVIGVVSGKGGVGKSMVTSLLAVSLKRQGFKTAILDADITGPSIPRAFGLTEKETEILTLIADGQSNKEIASSLYMGEGTVRNAISVILEKLHLRDRTQLAIFYYRNVRQ